MSTDEFNINTPNVKNLKKIFETLDDAIDGVANADMGAGHYQKAKKRTLTLSLKKRERNYSDLRSIFEKPSDSPSASPTPGAGPKRTFSFKKTSSVLQELAAENQKAEEAAKEEQKPAVSEPTPTPIQPADTKEAPKEEEKPVPTTEETPKEEPESTTQDEEEPTGPVFVKSDKDLVSILMDVIHEAFYNPNSGLWPSYDGQFKREDYTSAGKLGWDHKMDTDHRLAARELINQKKNDEMERLLGGDFVKKATEQVYETISQLVSGIKKRDVRRGIKNHIRVHLYYLIYGQENVTNNSRFKQ